MPHDCAICGHKACVDWFAYQYHMKQVHGMDILHQPTAEPAKKRTKKQIVADWEARNARFII